MIPQLTDHLWQSTVFTLAAGLLAVALRRNRAHVRYWLWFAASLKFFVPFAWLMFLGSQLALAPSAAPMASTAVPAVSFIMEPFAQTLADAPPVELSALPPPAAWIPMVLVGLWACGFVAIALLRLRGWRRIRAAVGASMPAEPPTAGLNVPVRSSFDVLEPGVVGWWRPILLLPEGIEAHLTPRQLEAVLAHELCHVRRRDNLTAAIHMIVEALVWFHPLVWWISARLLDERERACDEAVLSLGTEPAEYATGILSVCKLYGETPLACVSGVTGSDLKRRIAHIMANRSGRRLTVAGRLVLATSALATLTIPVIAGAITAPLRTRPGAQAAQTSSATFDVASVKPCAPDASLGAGRHIEVSRNRVYLECYTVESLIEGAYAYNGKFTLRPSGLGRAVRGVPDWIRSDRYTIEATAASEVATGPMLRALLEERFALRTHRVSEQIPMYALTVAKGGLKIKSIADGDCLEEDAEKPVAAPASQGRQKPFCGMVAGRRRGGVRLWDLGGGSLSDLADVLETDRQVLDQTGVTTRFNIHLEYALDDTLASAPSPDRTDSSAPSVYRALEEQLGLKLVSIKGPHEYFVVDHIERPTSDQSSMSSPQKFEVASIRPCENTPGVPGGRNGGAGPVFSPGLFVYNCGTLEQLINGAYVANGDPLLNDEGRGAPDKLRDEKTFPQRIRGGPGWMRTERFMIEAKTAESTGSTGRDAVPERRVMMGPMLRALLEDRFKLKLHREVQDDVPMYALTIAKTGLKIKPAGADSCAPPDPNRKEPYQMQEEIEVVRRGGKPICGHGIMGGPLGPNNALVLNGQTMEGVAHFLSGVMDRHVLDRTGLTDKFVMYLEYAPDDLVPYDFLILPRTADPPTAPSITQVLKSLGLELQPTKGPKGFIVIDHVEHPTRGFPAFAAEAAPGGTPAAGRAGGR